MPKRHKINYYKNFVIKEPIQASLIDVNFKLMVSSVTFSSQRTTTQENNGAQVGGQIKLFSDCQFVSKYNLSYIGIAHQTLHHIKLSHSFEISCQWCK